MPLNDATLNNSADRQHDHNREVMYAYPVEVSALCEDEGGGFQALFPPLARSVVGYGLTPQEAITDLWIVVPTFLELMEETDQTLPEAPAEKEWDDFSGKFNVRIAKVLHAQLADLAEEQGVSLNSLVQTILTSGATALTAGKRFGALEPSDDKHQPGGPNGTAGLHANGSRTAAA